AGYRFRKFVRRHKGPVLAAALVVLALVGGLIGATWGMLRATSAEAVAEAEAQQKEQERVKAVQESERATRAERNARHQLFHAKLAQARASRWSGRMGQRLQTLQALAEAAALLPDLRLESAETAKIILELRNEAIAAMTLV